MIQAIRIMVEMKRSKQWGSNPHVYVRIDKDESPYSEEHHTSSSGAGYCKRSDALARALNRSEAVRQFLATEATKFAYGADRDGFKVGGVGMSAILDVFEKNGFTVNYINFVDVATTAYYIHR